MKPSSNRYKILSFLSPDKGEGSYSLSGPELRILSHLNPLKFRTEIRALVNLGWVGSIRYRYQITPAGKAALMEVMKKGIQDNEKQKELFK
jgi:hypothetical protein